MKKLLPAILSASIILAGAAWIVATYISIIQIAPTEQPKIKKVKVRSVEDIITDEISSLSLRDKVALNFIFHTTGTDTEQISAFLTNYKPGGIILMGDNMPTTNEELKSLTTGLRGESEFPPLISIDQEGGTVRRILSDEYLAGNELSKAPVDVTYDTFSQRSQLLRSLGITLNFGIVADVTDDPASFIYPRVLGTDARTASERVRAAVDASKGKVYSTLKHFPGHGESAEDSHAGVPSSHISLEEWRRRDAPPFEAGIKAGAEFVMMGHLQYDTVDTNPASLSKKWHEILRSELKFDGIIVSDDMFMLLGDPIHGDMKAGASQALLAGTTMLLYVTQNGEGTEILPEDLIEHVVSEVESGRISKKTIERNARKILEAQYESRNF